MSGQYKINGVVGTKENGLIPSHHHIDPAKPTTSDTIGGRILVDPPTGNLRVHTWTYDGRSTQAIYNLMQAIGDSRLCVISTPDVQRDTLGRDIWYEDLKVVVEIPGFATQDGRALAGAFDVVWTELTPQT